jgi:hypothetical protein
MDDGIDGGSVDVATRLDIPVDVDEEPARQARWGWLVGRVLGAVAVVVMGVVHLQEYRGPYAAIPTIGPLFLVNFVAAMLVGAALLAPIEHMAGRWAGRAVAVVAAGGIVLAAGSFVMLWISERRPLFGFQEPGYDPTAIAVSRYAEVAAVVLLAGSLLGRFAGSSPKRRW